MQSAAQQVMAEFGGQMPADLAGLLSLKGIGPYTAAAIGSMAFGLVEPALDGNLFRIVARLFEIEEDIALPKTRKTFMAILYQLIDPQRPGDFNQALMETMESFELICVDDGSTDSSLELLNAYAERDARIKVYPREGAGAAAARNFGLTLVSAPYTLILDSDDIFMPTMFEDLLERAEKTQADLVVCNSCDFDGETYMSTPTPWVLKLNMLPQDAEVFSAEDAAGTLFEAIMGWPWDRLYRTSFLAECGLTFPEDYENSEDGVYVYGVLARAKRISVLPQVLIKHRSSRKDSISNSRERAPEDFYRAICAIKADLAAESGRYERFAKSFLNWALDYAMWNIHTLTDERLKGALAKKLTSGGYPELEVTQHPWSYFNLYPNMRRRYLKMQLLGKRA